MEVSPSLPPSGYRKICAIEVSSPFLGGLNTDDASEITRLRECSTRKDQEKLLADFMMRHRGRLRSMVDLRLHHRLRARVSPSDVLQEVFLDASKKLAAYLRSTRLPIFLWLRRITADKLHDLHRHHLGAKARDARRETPIAAGPAGPEATSATLAMRLAKEGPSPSNAAMEAERRASLETALQRMDPLDREILALRCFERLSGKEAALVLGIEAAAARQRYFRALKRLKEIIGAQWHPGQEQA